MSAPAPAHDAQHAEAVLVVALHAEDANALGHAASKCKQQGGMDTGQSAGACN